MVIFLVECHCSNDRTQGLLLAGLSEEGQRYYRDGMWRPILDFGEALESACYDPRSQLQDVEVHRAYAAALHSLLTQLHFMEEDAMSWIRAPADLLRPIDDAPRPSKRPRCSEAARQRVAGAPPVQNVRLHSDEAEECAEEGKKGIGQRS